MAAMTSRFNIRCVIQYYSDQWVRRFARFQFLCEIAFFKESFFKC